MRKQPSLSAARNEGRPNHDSFVFSEGLPPHERRFAEEYFAGEHAGNGTRSYQVVHPEASYATASVAASELLKSPKIKEFLAELHDQATQAIAGKLQDWAELLPVAQNVILATAQGRMRSRLAFEASVYVVNRAQGLPQASTELVVRDERKVAQALNEFARRVAEMNRQQPDVRGESRLDLVGSTNNDPRYPSGQGSSAIAVSTKHASRRP